ncbi:Beta-tubulin_2 [Hexamita inflata]|uniref:Beta-tubulin 2 n=1 Tax=Hexamita inflata TaxID=28002 RepID=A0AA86TQS8_9EUKA|nr:Beta-tubulin 2 [Hexamita inflata]
MHETVTISIGECGNNIGAQFWRDCCTQSDLSVSGHSLHPQVSPPSHLFEEQVSSRFVPRAILLDSDPGTLANIRNSDLGFLFPPSAYISGSYGAGNSFGNGCYDPNLLELIQEPLNDQIRIQAEKCDQTPNFNLFHSLGNWVWNNRIHPFALERRIQNERFQLLSAPGTGRVCGEPLQLHSGLELLNRELKRCVML